MAQAKMSQSQAQNIFHHKHKLYCFTAALPLKFSEGTVCILDSPKNELSTMTKI